MMDPCGTTLYSVQRKLLVYSEIKQFEGPVNFRSILMKKQ